VKTTLPPDSGTEVGDGVLVMVSAGITFLPGVSALLLPVTGSPVKSAASTVTVSLYLSGALAGADR